MLERAQRDDLAPMTGSIPRKVIDRATPETAAATAGLLQKPERTRRGSPPSRSISAARPERNKNRTTIAASNTLRVRKGEVRALATKGGSLTGTSTRAGLLSAISITGRGVPNLGRLGGPGTGNAVRREEAMVIEKTSIVPNVTISIGAAHLPLKSYIIEMALIRINMLGLELLPLHIRGGTAYHHMPRGAADPRTQENEAHLRTLKDTVDRPPERTRTLEVQGLRGVSRRGEVARRTRGRRVMQVLVTIVGTADHHILKGGPRHRTPEDTVAPRTGRGSEAGHRRAETTEGGADLLPELISIPNQMIGIVGRRLGTEANIEECLLILGTMGLKGTGCQVLCHDQDSFPGGRLCHHPWVFPGQFLDQKDRTCFKDLICRCLTLCLSLGQDSQHTIGLIDLE